MGSVTAGNHFGTFTVEGVLTLGHSTGITGTATVYEGYLDSTHYDQISVTNHITFDPTTGSTDSVVADFYGSSWSINTWTLMTSVDGNSGEDSTHITTSQVGGPTGTWSFELPDNKTLTFSW
jgi:hypothetical protein